jgi:dihydrofolate reductase
MTQGRKLVVSEWITLDGVFDADTMNAWFNPYESDERGQYIKEGIDASDALLLGRVTYQMLASYWPNMKNNEMGVADSLNGMAKYVVSTKLETADWNNSKIVRNAAEAVTRLKQQPGKDILIFGSAALVQSLPAGLVDEYRFLVHPVLMGSGKRAFQEGAAVTKLALIDSKKLPSGVVALSYRSAR